MSAGSWRIQVLDNNDQVIARLERARDIRLELKLSGTPSCSFKLDIDDDKATDAILSTGINDIEVYRDDTKIYRGRIWNKTKQYDGDNGEVTVDTYGYFALLEKRLAGKDDTREFTDTDAGTICWTLINESQNETGGDLGITEGTIQTSTNRDRSYRYKKISEAITELADADSGIDFEITPDLVFNVYYPYQGSTNDNIVFNYPGAIESVEQADQSGEIVNYLVGLGKAFGETEIRTKDDDADSILTYGRREDVANYRDVDNVTTLGNMLIGDVERFKNLVAVYRITVNQDESKFEWGDWGIGDSVRFKVNTAKWEIDKTLRILAVEFQIDYEGRETVVFTTGEVGASGVAGGASRSTEIPTIESEISEIDSRVEKLELNPTRGAMSVIVAEDAEDGDYTDIQEAIDKVNELGGGTVYVKAGTYTFSASNLLDLGGMTGIHLVGEDVEGVILDFTGLPNTLGERDIAIDSTERTSTGTVALANASATVTGTGTAFSTDGVAVGDLLYVEGMKFTVSAITDNTHLTISETYYGAAISGKSFVIVSAPALNCSIENITISGNNQRTGIYSSYSDSLSIKNIKATGYNQGILLWRSFNYFVYQTHCTNCTNGIDTQTTSSDVLSTGVILDCKALNNAGYGITLDNGAIGVENHCIGNEYGIQAVNESLAYGNYTANNNTKGIYITGNKSQIENNIVLDGITDEGTGTIRRGNSDGIVSPSFRAYRTSNQTITAGAYKKIRFGTEDYDYGAVYDNATNYRFTAPIAGMYHFDASIVIDNLGDRKTLLTTLYKNGSVIAWGAQQKGSGAGDVGSTVNVDLELAANDYIEVYVYVSSGAGTTVLGADEMCYFNGRLIG